MTDLTLVQEDAFVTRFPEILSPDDRKGYSGYLVQPDNLIEVATAIRDEWGYDYLTSLTAVDYLPDGFMEVVYHLYRSTGGSGLVLKTRTPREDSRVPSLVPVYPGAEFQEREVWDLFGVHFEGHPDLRRILMWEGFDGHPLRKDWKEPFFEEEGKPFKSRWPDGHIYRIEDKNPFYKQCRLSGWFRPGFLGPGKRHSSLRRSRVDRETR